MKTISLIVLILPLSLVISACCTSIPLPPECGIEGMKTGFVPDYPFSTDGCSMSPGLDKGVKCCCVEHDFEYWQGGAAEQRKDADLRFKQCMKDSGHTFAASLYYPAVRVFGTPYLPTCWRWGFGWKYGRGYKANE